MARKIDDECVQNVSPFSFVLCIYVCKCVVVLSNWYVEVCVWYCTLCFPVLSIYNVSVS